MPLAPLVRSFLLLAAAFCAPAALVGCGPSSAAVSGAITLNGQPPKLKGMQITFIAADGRMGSAVIGEDGAYQAVGVPTGVIGIGFVYTPVDEVQQPMKASPKLPRPSSAPDKAMPPPPPPPANPIPEPLRDASTSHLTLKVESGKKNTFNYDIKR